MGEETEHRRAVDARFAEIAGQISALQHEMSLNTEVTTQVRDILTSFSLIAKVAKWMTAVGAFVIMCWHGWQRITGR